MNPSAKTSVLEMPSNEDCQTPSVTVVPLVKLCPCVQIEKWHVAVLMLYTYQNEHKKALGKKGNWWLVHEAPTTTGAEKCLISAILPDKETT